MVSLRWVFVSFPAGGETASRKREQPSQADLQARRVQNIAQLTASDPAAIATLMILGFAGLGFMAHGQKKSKPALMAA